jgi:hypothetical protein
MAGTILAPGVETHGCLDTITDLGARRLGSVWKLVNETDNGAARAHFERQTCDC